MKVFIQISLMNADEKVVRDFNATVDHPKCSEFFAKLVEESLENMDLLEAEEVDTP